MNGIAPKRIWRREVSTGQNLGEVITFRGWQKEISLQKRLKEATRKLVGKSEYMVSSRHTKRMLQVGGSCSLGQMLFVDNNV